MSLILFLAIIFIWLEKSKFLFISVDEFDVEEELPEQEDIYILFIFEPKFLISISGVGRLLVEK